jgi:hypothetical protein
METNQNGKHEEHGKGTSFPECYLKSIHFLSVVFSFARLRPLIMSALSYVWARMLNSPQSEVTSQIPS